MIKSYNKDAYKKLLSLFVLGFALFLNGCYMPFLTKYEFKNEIDVAGIPVSITFSDGKFYCLEAKKGKILVLDDNGVIIRKIKNKVFKDAFNLTVRNGKIFFVANPSKKAIYVTTKYGRIVKKIISLDKLGERRGSFPIENVSAVSVKDKKLAVITLDGKMGVIDLKGFVAISKKDDAGIAMGKLNFPKGVFLDFDNTIYVADTFNRRLDIFSLNGTRIVYHKTISNKDKLQRLRAPRDVVATDKELFVADTGWEPIVIYDKKTLNVKGYVGSFGDKRGHLMMPVSLAVSDDGLTLAVVDIYRKKVLFFKRK